MKPFLMSLSQSFNRLDLDCVDKIKIERTVILNGA